MSTEAMEEEIHRDLWLRVALAGLALVAALGMGLAWRGLERSAELRVNLIRSREQNAYLQEKNIAAAGLAHETRNPLNMIRGLAQVISKDASVPQDVRQRTGDLIEQVDRVTGRLQEFLDYSKPVEPHTAPTDLAALVRGVAWTLETDREDKEIRLSVDGPELTVEADPSLLRQALFNLLLNAFQAVGRGGEVGVTVSSDTGRTARVEVRDDGPGVPEESREEIFRPYVTLGGKGTGLGLALVRQIAQAQGWEVACGAGADGGAVFSVSGLKLTGKAS
jgi:signal transduction histidine kinase